mgnify:CR=1 FL=1
METCFSKNVLYTQLCSYRTYEEWKLLPRAIKKIAQLVLTVPMRNGNRDVFADYCAFSKVLTVPMRNGNAFASALALIVGLVLTVPMRNGNAFVSSRIGMITFSVLTVPMRNGNLKSM